MSHGAITMKHAPLLVATALLVVLASCGRVRVSHPSATSTSTRAIGALPPPGTAHRAPIYADLDGDGDKEVVLASRTPGSKDDASPFVKVFSRAGGEWRVVFDAARNTLQRPGAAHSPPLTGPPLAREKFSERGVSEPFVVSKSLAFVDVIDFASNATPELVLAVHEEFGASGGAFEVWVVGYGADGYKGVFYDQSFRTGAVLREGNTLRITSDLYGRKDAQCCPSQEEVKIVAYDKVLRTIRVVERSTSPARNT